MTTINLPDEHEPVTDDASEVLLGIDSNAGAIMGTVTRALRAAGNPTSVLDAYRREAMSGDYDHLLAASMTYLEGS